MRDKLKACILEVVGDSNWGYLSDAAQTRVLVGKIESFMRKYKLKMMARPDSSSNPQRAAAWDAALLTPWSDDV